MPGKFKPSFSRRPPGPSPAARGITVDEGLLQARRPLEKDDSTDSVSDSSQQTDYGFSGDNDITHLIMSIPCTQPAGDENTPHSDSSSERSLGKRKASDFSTSSTSSMSSTLFPPSKIPRRTFVKEDEDNPFVETPETPPEDPTGPICLSPSQVLQNLFNNKKLPYGAQYEISRLVSMGKLRYGDILIDDVDKLAKMGTNREAAPATAKLLLKHKYEDDESYEYEKTAFAKERAAKSPWEEFDREEEVFRKSPYGGLGFDENGEPMDWYGGRVLFHAKLHDVTRDRKSCSAPQFKITLEPAELSSSHSFARRFGSKHFLRLKLTKPVLNKSSKQLLEYIQRPLILCGCVFRGFYAKEKNVFYVKTNEATDGTSILPNVLVPNIMSFWEFINWHNPIELNPKQTMAKYASRFALGLSNSVPGIMVNISNLHFIDDIVCPETQSNMTDGAGKTNRWTLKQLRHRIEWEDKPTAIQTRIYGTKGLLVEDIRNTDEFSYVELTPSQRKIVYPSGVPPDPAHCIIDVLRSSHAKSPCRLSVETIINLSENGVPKIVFLDLLRQGLKELIEPLLAWEGPDAMRDLWCNMRRLGGVMSARRAREDAGLARVKGYSEYESDEDEQEDEDGILDVNEQKSSAWWGDEISGCPSSLEETVMCLIDSGFTPQNCPVLRSKLEKVVKGYVKNYVKSYRIEVPMSASAFIIPDTLGILEPGEIFFKHSKNKFRTLDGLGTDVLLGTVLVTRHPCKLPTDVQKWVAVDKPELHHLVDVVILSTKGTRRAADLLSGGDYDGDKGLVIFQPEVVEAFKESPLHYSEPPADIKLYFKRENEEVVEFLHRVAPLNEASKIHHLQQYLLGAVRDTSVVGKYSNFHENATYLLGYTNEETIRLAYMFCMALDGIKTGMTVREEVMKHDAMVYQKRPPQWKETEEERDRFHASGSNESNLQRPPKLKRFIMDELHKQAEVEGDQWLARIEGHFDAPNRCKIDEDLVAPWNRAIELSNRWAKEENNTRMKDELEAIASHVKGVYADHRGSLASPNKASRASPKKGAAFSGLPIEVRQDAIRKLSRKFVSFPHPGTFLMQDEEIARLRASYAYKHDHEARCSGWTRFPWDVAMRELGAIKARATGRHKTIASNFYDHFNMKHSKDYHI